MKAVFNHKQSPDKKRDLLDIVFFAIYLLVSFFIVIGEGTQIVVLAPYKLLKSAFSRTLGLFSKPRGRGRPRKKVPFFRSAQFLALRRFASRSLTNIAKLTKLSLKSLSYWTIFITKRVIDIALSILNRFLRVIIRVFRSIARFILSFFTLRLRFFLLGVLITVVFFGTVQVKEFIRDLPSPRQIGSVNYPLSTHIYDRNGRLLYEVYRDQNRTPVKITDLPSYIKEATVAFEDKDFYRHGGVSLYSGILRALKETVLKNNLQGGSTITQQLVKSALLTPERSLERKAKEIVLAIWAEQIYDKNQILEMYLNQVPYGGSAYGIEEAAKTYFGKPAKELTLSQAALLAGLPQAPSVYSPFVDPALAIQRRNDVLAIMEDQKYITQEQSSRAQKEPLNTLPPQTLIKAPHFVFHVKSNMEQEFGVREVEEGGFKVTTTLDLELQQEAEKILKEELEKVRHLNVTNGAILVTRPSTGEILAMVGSVDYFNSTSGAYNVTTALRQPGSSIKPLMFSLALEKNYTAATTIDDSPTTFRISNYEAYKPVNYDGKFHGRVPLRYALANSYNIPAVKVLNTLGVDNFVDHARRMGITTWRDPSQYGLSLTLGGGEVKMVDMATAFGVFANGGYKVPVKDIITLVDSKNQIRNPFKQEKTKILDEGVAFIMSDILSDNQARYQAFGPGNQLEISGQKVAVKTGTTDNKKDNWTIGYTPEYLVAVWVGNNDGAPMNPFLTSGVTGAAPIWHRVMEHVLKNYDKDGNSWFQKPENVVERNCYGGRVEYFLAGTENDGGCSSYGRPTPAPRKDDKRVDVISQPTPTPQENNNYNRGRGKNNR